MTTKQSINWGWFGAGHIGNTNYLLRGCAVVAKVWGPPHATSYVLQLAARQLSTIQIHWRVQNVSYAELINSIRVYFFLCWWNTYFYRFSSWDLETTSTTNARFDRRVSVEDLPKNRFAVFKRNPRPTSLPLAFPPYKQVHKHYGRCNRCKTIDATTIATRRFVKR